MNQRRTQLKALTPVPGALAIALVLSIAAACNQSEPASTGGYVNSTPTTSPTMLPAAATATHVQLSTRTPGPPPTDIPYPSPTVVLGIKASCQIAGYYQFVFRSCWVGIFNGQFISVGTGIDQAYTDPNQPDQGVLVLYRGPYMVASDKNPKIYYTPQGTGVVDITSVEGTKITLAQVTFYGDPITNGQTIIFDLATSQFQTVSGTPIPTFVPPTIPPRRS